MGGEGRGDKPHGVAFTNQLPVQFFLDKDINWDDVNLKKLKVRDLKKILSNWGEICDGCLEKTDYIKRIEELKPKYVHTEL